MKNKYYNRKLLISEDHKQITLPDQRYYQRNGKYYPSITHVLQAYPKGKYYEDWLKKVGYSSEYIVKKAAEEGTYVHNLIEQYLLGAKITFLDSKGHPKMHHTVWNMFLKFVEFWETHKPTLIETETFLFSDELQIAGTCDLVCEIDGEIWVIDLKTSNHLQTTYDLQISFYAKAYEEGFKKKVDRIGVLWLKSGSRKPDPKNKKLKGKGWELYEPERSIKENLEILEAVHTIFKIENPKPHPVINSWRTEVIRKE